MRATQFDHLGLIAPRQFYWMASPGAYEHSLAIKRLLAWCLQLPNVRLGVDPQGIGSIVKGIYHTRQKRLTVTEEQFLDRVAASDDDDGIWEFDEAVFDKHLTLFLETLRGADGLDGYVWVAKENETEWIDIITDSLTIYHEIYGRSDVKKLSVLMDRHHCALFGPFVPEEISMLLGRLPQLAQAEHVPKLLELLAEFTNISRQIQLPQDMLTYWTWKLLDFSEIGEASLLQSSSLGLWNFWPSHPQWAPSPKEAVRLFPLEGDTSAKYLEDILWQTMETIFSWIANSCGLPTDAVIKSANRNNYAPVFYYAAPSPSTPILEPEDFMSPAKINIHPLVKTCLLSDDPRSSQTAWGVLQGRIAAVRREWAGTTYRARYLLLPLVSEPANEDIGEVALEGELAWVTWLFAYRELQIEAKADRIERSARTLGAKVSPWGDPLDEGIGALESALGLFPVVGRADRARMWGELRRLHAPLRRLRAFIAQAESEYESIKIQFDEAKDETDDALRRMTISPIARPGIRDLRDALIDAYPFHYLEIPVKALDFRIATFRQRSELITSWLNALLSEVAESSREQLERSARWLAGIIGLLAVLIGLPTFIPDATLSKDTYPRWLDSYVPLSTVQDIALIGAAVVGVAALVAFLIFLLNVLRLFRPSYEDDAQRYMAILEEARNGAQNHAGQQRVLEDLDAKAAEWLARIWDEIEANPRGERVRLWPFAPLNLLQAGFRAMLQRLQIRSALADTWSARVRQFVQILDVFILLPQSIVLPRTLCVLRFKSINSVSLDSITLSYFRNSLLSAGFDDEEIEQLDRWLSNPHNRSRVNELGVRTLTTILKSRGVTALYTKRALDRWQGPLDEAQQFANQAQQLYGQDQYTEAVASWKQAITLDSHNPKFYAGLAEASDALGRLPAAAKAYQRAIRLAPMNPYYHNNLGDIYLRLKRLGDAKHEFTARIELGRDDALAAHTSLATILIQEGQSQKGKEHAEWVVKRYQRLAPRQDVMSGAEFESNYALALAALGSEQAASIWQDILSQPGISVDALRAWLMHVQLLASASQAPAHIEQIVALLKEVIDNRTSAS